MKNDKIDEEEYMKKDNYVDSEEDALSEISASLAKQISDELDEDTDDIYENDEETIEKKKFPKWAKITCGVGGVLLVVIIGALLYFNGLLDLINYDDGKNASLIEESFDKDDISGNNEVIDPNDVKWQSILANTRKEGVINILLLGEEAMADNGRGRSDSMMIATINVKKKTLSLTSLMRDTYVQIPGYSDNKLNAAYKFGGIQLLYETIKLNFQVEMDGYVLVNFEDFENIINELGGVDITLSADEASYLNRTNYISKKEYRNVKAGTQTLNGNQALGYSRIRYVKTSENVRDDFGRTSRQRVVLNAIFEKYKTLNATEMVAMLPDILPLVTTDLTKDEIIGYISTLATLGATELHTFRLPIDNGYTPATIRSMSVLVMDTVAENVTALHEFLFGESSVTVVPSSNDSSNINNSSNQGTTAATATPAPVKTAVPTAKPTVKPTATPKPEETPEPEETPDYDPPETEEPVETVAPTKKPAATETPVETVEPTQAPQPTQTPAATQVPTEEPSSGEVLDGGE
jgi:LCP family protein required for cell wall assembly